MRALPVAMLAGLALLPARLVHAQAVSSADCVTLGLPKPTLTFAYRRSDGGGPPAQYTHRWTEITPERATVAVARGRVNEIVTNRHRVEQDVTMIAATASKSSTGSHRTDFRPAAMGNPFSRACAGRSWSIKAVTATHTAGAQVTTARTHAGTMKIVALRETVEVPAGRFLCLRYTRTLSTPTGTASDEYWKSIEHGVVVKHVSRLGNWSSTEELVAIR